MSRPLRALLPFAAFWLYAARAALLKQAVILDRAGGGAGPWEAVAFHAMLAVLVCAFPVCRRLRREGGAGLDRRSLSWIGVRGLAGGLSVACAFYGVAHIPLGINSLIQNSGVFVAALFAWAMLGEVFTGETAAFSLLGYAGLALCVSVSLRGGGDALGYAVSSASLFLDGMVYVAIRKARRVRTLEMVLGNALCSLALCGIWFAGHPFRLPQATAAWAAFLAVAASGLAANVLFTESVRRAASTVTVALAKYTAPVLLAAVGWACFAEPMTPLQTLGYGLALAGGLASQLPEGVLTRSLSRKRVFYGVFAIMRGPDFAENDAVEG